MAERDLKPALSSLAALGGVLAAFSCCLPLPVIIASAGLAGASSVLVSLRPWLMGASLLLLAFGFWQTYRRASCSRGRGIATKALLWLSLAIIVAMLLFPQTIAGWLADLA
jgi:hypothetical protein